MKLSPVLCLALLAGIHISVPAQSLEVSWTLNQTQVEAVLGPGISGQTSFLESVLQTTFTQEYQATGGVKIFGYFLGSLENLPSGNPLVLPPSKVVFSSCILEGGLSWEVLPGVIVWDLGKKILHPSSGFFKTPLNLLSRENSQTGAAALNTKEEGWVGTGITWFTEPVTFTNYFSPRLTWSPEMNDGLKYLSSPQNVWQHLSRLSFRLWETDVQILGLLEVPDLLEPALNRNMTVGMGLDTQLGDGITIRAEATLEDHHSRMIPDVSQVFKEETQRRVLQGLAGFTWTLDENFNLMVEYGYNGRGFFGQEYDELLDYGKTRTPAHPDLLNQNGTFNAARNYGFLRLAGDLEDHLDFDAWVRMNLQDASGIYGGSMNLVKDHWGLSLKTQQVWGGEDTEGRRSVILWKVLLEAKVSY